MRELCPACKNENVICSKENHVFYIMLNRPKCLNAMNDAAACELRDAWIEFNRDDDARVAVLYGSGDRAFCSGADTKSVIGASLPPDRSAMSDCMPDALCDNNKPIICAIQGYCIGAGFVFTMKCDLRIAATNAKFVYPEANMGITSGKASVLTKHIPLAIAYEILFLGEPLTAQRAYEIGYVNKLVEPEELLNEATKMAEVIAKNSPSMSRLLKAMLKKSVYTPPMDTCDDVYKLLYHYRNSDDAKEALDAINEKRLPNYK